MESCHVDLVEGTHKRVGLVAGRTPFKQQLWSHIYTRDNIYGFETHREKRFLALLETDNLSARWLVCAWSWALLLL